MLDKFNRYECDEETGINLLYKGKSLKHVEFKESNDIDHTIKIVVNLT